MNLKNYFFRVTLVVTMERRRFLAVAGAATVTGLAGCIGGGDSGSGGSPKDPVTDFYKAAQDNPDDQEALLEAAKATLHSESPLRGLLEMVFGASESESTTTTTQIPESIETEVTSEDISKSDISSQFSTSQISDNRLESIAGNNAVVKAAVTYKDGSEETTRYLVTKEDGEWVIFLFGM